MRTVLSHSDFVLIEHSAVVLRKDWKQAKRKAARPIKGLDLAWIRVLSSKQWEVVRSWIWFKGMKIKFSDWMNVEILASTIGMIASSLTEKENTEAQF